MKISLLEKRFVSSEKSLKILRHALCAQMDLVSVLLCIIGMLMIQDSCDYKLLVFWGSRSRSPLRLTFQERCDHHSESITTYYYSFLMIFTWPISIDFLLSIKHSLIHSHFSFTTFFVAIPTEKNQKTHLLFQDDTSITFAESFNHFCFLQSFTTRLSG